MDADALEVRDASAEGRYELCDGDQVVGFATYRRVDDRVVVPHVEVVRRLEGKGLGGRLVQGMLDDLRARGLRVTPWCSFAAGWIRRHPEYHDLQA
jgi:uncharacterized protein